MVEQVPKISRMFAMLEPMILPNANEVLRLTRADTLDATSGRDVPAATMVIAMIASLTPQARSIAVAES